MSAELTRASARCFFLIFAATNSPALPRFLVSRLADLCRSHLPEGSKVTLRWRGGKPREMVVRHGDDWARVSGLDFEDWLRPIIYHYSPAGAYMVNE
jgi:hypothetical protein